MMKLFWKKSELEEEVETKPEKEDKEPKESPELKILKEIQHTLHNRIVCWNCAEVINNNLEYHTWLGLSFHPDCLDNFSERIKPVLNTLSASGGSFIEGLPVLSINEGIKTAPPPKAPKPNKPIKQGEK